MRTNLVLLCAAAAALLVGCSGESDAKDSGSSEPAVFGKQTDGTKATDGTTGKTGQALTIVHGTWGEASVGLDNARVVAIADDHTTFWAYLDAKGGFTLELPVGVSYRIIFANQLDGGGQVKIGSLVFKSEAGFSEWFGANVSGTVDLGLVTTSESGSTEISGSAHLDSTPDDSCTCKKDDGSAKKNPSSGDGVNVCLIWPTVPVFPSVVIDGKFADSKEHTPTNYDDDQTCGYWDVEGGGIVWAAPGVGLGVGFGPIEFGADIGISANSGGSGGFGYGGGFGYNGGYSMSSSWSYDSSMSYGLNGGFGASGSYHFSMSSSWSYNANVKYDYQYTGGWSFNYNSAVNYSWNSKMGSAGTVGIAGGVVLGAAWTYESDVQVGGVIAASNVNGGWAVGYSSEFHADFAAGACVSASTCDQGLSCTAGKCIKH